MDSKDTACAEGDVSVAHTKVDAAVVSPFMSIKLFGTTVLVTDCQKSSPSGVEPFLLAASKVSLENLDADNEKRIEKLAWKQLDTQLSLGMVNTNWNPLPYGVPVHQCTELGRESATSLETNPPPPWSVFCQGLPFIYPASYDQTSAQNSMRSCVEERSEEKGILNERSCTSSNTGSVAEVENRERNLDVDSQCQQPYAEGRVMLKVCRKGFVPYKRCSGERDVKSTVTMSEEREQQRARICS